MSNAGPVAAFASVLLVAGVAVGIAVEGARRNDVRHERGNQLTLIDSAFTARVSDLRDRIDRIQELAADGHRDLGAAGLDELLRMTAIKAVGNLGQVGGRLVQARTDGAAPSPGDPAHDALTAPGALVAAELSRDLGTPRAVLVGDPKGSQILVFWARYSTVGPPVTTTDRRVLFTGWLVGRVSPGAAIAAPLAAASKIGLAPRLVLSVPADADLLAIPPAGVTPEGSPIAAGLAWHLDFPPLELGRPSGASWAAAGLGGLGALAVLCIGWLSARRQRVLANLHGDVTAQVRMLGDLGASLQESLDLGSVLPRVLSRLSKELTLDHIAVAVRDSSGHFQELFALGDVGSAATSDWVPSPAGPRTEGPPSDAENPVGALIAIPLRRDLRTIGQLTFVASRKLDQSAQTTLTSMADLIAGAVGNAALFDREQLTVRRLRDLDSLKDSFLATVSHELTTPLTILNGFTNLLNERWDQLSEHERRDAVARMQTHARWLSALVNDVLDFVTDRRDSSPIQLTELDLGETVSRHLDDLSPLLVHHRLTATLEPDVVVRSDVTAIQRIVANLVSNAVKFAPAGTEITVRVSREVPWALVALSDHGPGISPEDLDHIFQRFYRGKSDAAQATRGVGIGLSVVADWANQIGGQIAVESAVGAGTTMILRLPVLEHSMTQLPTPV